MAQIVPGLADFITACTEGKDAGTARLLLDILAGKTPQAFLKLANDVGMASTMKNQLRYFFNSKGYRGVTDPDIDNLVDNAAQKVAEGEALLQGY